MKKWALLLSFLLLLGLCAACGKAEVPETNWEPGWNIAEESDRKFTDALILTLIEVDLEANRVTYQIQNVSETVYGYGTSSDFKLEIFHKGAWCKMRHEPGWDMTAEMYILNPGETKEYTTSLIDTLPAGTYRFIKEISVDEGFWKGEFISCEFTVE